jgi:hypothetical protein
MTYQIALNMAASGDEDFAPAVKRLLETEDIKIHSTERSLS